MLRTKTRDLFVYIQYIALSWGPNVSLYLHQAFLTFVIPSFTQAKVAESSPLYLQM